MKPGDRVKVRYFDAHNLSVVWDGVLQDTRANGRGWHVKVGDVVLLFPADQIEVIDEKATEGSHVNQERPEEG